MNLSLVSRPCLLANSLISRNITAKSGSRKNSGVERRSAVKHASPIVLTSLPVRPSRPPSAYQLYAVQRHNQLKQSNPKTKFMETNHVASAEWKAGGVDESLRQQLQDQSTTAMERYKEQLKDYKSQLKQTVVLADVIDLMSKKSPSGEKAPKKMSGYHLFVVERTKGKSGNLIAAVAKEWSALSEWEKKRYNDRAAASADQKPSS